MIDEKAFREWVELNDCQWRRVVLPRPVATSRNSELAKSRALLAQERAAIKTAEPGREAH